MPVTWALHSNQNPTPLKVNLVYILYRALPQAEASHGFIPNVVLATAILSRRVSSLFLRT